MHPVARAARRCLPLMLQRTVGAMVGQKSKICSYRIPVQDPPCLHGDVADIAPNRWCLRGLAGAQFAYGGRVGSVDNSNHPISGVSRAALHGSLGHQPNRVK